MRTLVLFLALALQAFAAQSQHITTGDTVTFTPPETSTWQSFGQIRVEIGMKITSCASSSTIFKLDSWDASGLDWFAAISSCDWNQDFSLGGCAAGDLLQVHATVTLGTNTFPYLMGGQVRNQ